MPRGRKKADTKKRVVKKVNSKKVEIKDDIYEPLTTTGYHIIHKEWIEQFTVYLWMFRVPIFIYVWDIWEEATKEFFKKEWEKYWVKEEFEYKVWWKTLSESSFGHLIWLKKFDISTLVHELCHVTQNRMRFCWMEIDDETQAYFLQGLLDQILIMDKKHNFKFYRPLPLDD